jgi:hypothetical protein
MPLTQAQEERDYELRIEQMQTNIDKLRNDVRYESRKFAVQLIVGAAACVGAGVALANYVNSHQPPSQTPQAPQIIVIPYPAPAAPTRP